MIGGTGHNNHIKLVKKNMHLMDLLILIAFIFLPLFPLFIHLKSSLRLRARDLPPGPRPWPIIGNIPHFIWKNPHIIVSNLAKIHGPLMSLRLGSQTVIIASSPQAAREILKTHDRELSGRCAPKATPIKESHLKKFSLLWAADCSPHWKSVRVLWKAELFSNKALDSQVSLREKKVAEMVEYLGTKEGEIVTISEVVFAAVYNTMGNICFSRDLIGLGDEKTVSDWKETMWRFMESATSPMIADFFPALDGIGLDFLRKRKEAGKCMKKMFEMWGELIRHRKEDGGSKKYGDFLNFMMENGFLDIQMLFMLLEILPAGAGTLVSTIEWVMAELIKNRDSMIKLQQELQNHNQIDVSDFIKESHISHLPFLNACIKETLRLHPPIAFLPHSAQSTCLVMNSTVPKNSLVFVNLWAIGHDPDTWKDPFTFRPERFLDSNLEFKGQDYEFLPFGSGRRMCPGLPFANKEVHLILAALIGCFDWSLPDGGDPFELDMNEKYAVPLQRKRPLMVIPHRKL